MRKRKVIKKYFILALIGLCCLFFGLIISAFYNGQEQSEYQAIPKIAIGEQAVKHFSEALQLKTISYMDYQIDSSQYVAFNNWLERTYPLINQQLEHTIISDFSHIYHWKGQNSSEQPIMLYAHLDVVQVIDNEREAWRYDPWSGKMATDTIWGRGALDDKVAVLGILEAVEHCLVNGIRPDRDIYLCIGHDEEVGGKLGAQKMAEYFKSNDIQFAYALDEGLTITKDLIPNIDKQVSLIGIAQKGYCSVELSTKMDGGHSSMPSPETSIDVISKALTKLNHQGLSSRLTLPVKQMLSCIAPEMPFFQRIILSNQWLFAPLIKRSYEGSNVGNASIRTTTAATIFSSGKQENIIPEQATACLNFRLLQGDTEETVLDHIKKVIGDDRINITVIGETTPASNIANTNSVFYERVEQSILEVFPETIVSPGLVMAGTDAKHFSEVCDETLYFRPMIMHPKNLHTIHGINERIAIKEYEDFIRFYIRLVELN